MIGLLAEVKVLELTSFVAGPYCAMLLADMGAQVIKVEPLIGEDSRNVGNDFIEGESSLFLSLNRNKRSLCIDLRKYEGQRIFFQLMKDADVIIENYRP